MLTALLSLSLLASPAASPGAFCRCAQRTLASYFAQAEIVAIVQVSHTTVETPPGGAPRLEVYGAPVLRPRPFKGSLDGVVLATATQTASCGVPMETGATYVIFATRDPAEPRMARFDSCSGSRRYYGGAQADQMHPFIDVPNQRVVTRLSELSDAGPPVRPTTATPFHTSPACWSQPRYYHHGGDPETLRSRVTLTWDRDPNAFAEGTKSPNHAYRFWVRPAMPVASDGETVVMVDVERPAKLRIGLRGVVPPPQVSWISEKLLFIRASWGRVVATDLVVDVERGTLVYEEGARYGVDAFAQYRGACAGQCPCLAAPGSADSLATPPAHRPASGEARGLEPLRRRALAFLDGDWDGRVFTEAGGRRYTLSMLKGSLPREEYPAEVEDVREVGGVWWLKVSLYDRSPCSDPRAAPVHAGWVPAFSAAGRLVAGTYPGGC